jgi:hypothetical protein
LEADGANEGIEIIDNAPIEAIKLRPPLAAISTFGTPSRLARFRRSRTTGRIVEIEACWGEYSRRSRAPHRRQLLPHSAVSADATAALSEFRIIIEILQASKSLAAGALFG